MAKGKRAVAFQSVKVPETLDADESRFDPPVRATGLAALRIVPSEEEEEAVPELEPEPEPIPVPSSDADPLALLLPSVEDVDRLWDWIRADPVPSPTLAALPTSLALHQAMAAFTEAEAQGTAMLRSVYWHGEHVGFGYLSPIHGPYGVAHAYLNPDRRGLAGVRILRRLFHAARAALPGLHLVVLVKQRRLQRLAARLGFDQTTYLAVSAPHEEEAD